MRSKRIKVQYSSRSTGGSYFCPTRYTAYPKIQMEGKWLEVLGFNVGDSLNVEYEEGRIIITLIAEEVMMVAEPAGKYNGGK